MEQTIMDEATLRQMDALKADRAAALTAINNLRRQDQSNHELIDTLTAKNIELKREILKVKSECRKTISECRNAAQRREATAAILGAIAGLLTTGVIVVIYYATRAGIM
jgi:predicted RNase H-like nuclease (RuvC/YqgF family)